VAGAAKDSRLRGGQGITSTDLGTAGVFSFSISYPAASSSRIFGHFRPSMKGSNMWARIRAVCSGA